MSNQWYDPARILAQLSPAEQPMTAIQNQGRQKTDIENRNVVADNSTLNTITVSESGEATLLPDIARVFITYKSIKETVDATKHSVQRRIDYILQALRNNSVKESQYTLHRNLERCGDNFQLTVEFCIEFRDFKTCENVCNFLVEKLDETVAVSKPVFSHSSGKLESLRQQACLNAIKNTRSKALAISQFLNQKLGAAVTVKEDETSETVGATSTDQSIPELNIKRRIEAATVIITVKMTVSFELEPKTKKKNQ
eukprot:gene410-1045_t